MRVGKTIWISLLVTFATILAVATPATAQQQRPNVIMIMGDDIGWNNIGVYNQGIMAGRTPNLDQLAAQGMRFTDYYAEASCTAAGQISSPESCPTARD
jgi:arylsulfatase